MMTMSSRLFSALAGVALLTIATGRGEAGVLYSALPDPTQLAFASSSASGGEQELTPFQVTAESTATGLDWWGTYGTGPATDDTYTIGLYTGTSTGPNSTADTIRTVTPTRTDTLSTNVDGEEIYKYSATLASPFSLAGGTQYYIAILSNHSPQNWSWQLDGSGTNYFRTGGDGTPWIVSAFPRQDAFDLTGTPTTAAPEPSTLVLGGLAGLVGLGCAWNRRRRPETGS